MVTDLVQYTVKDVWVDMNLLVEQMWAKVCKLIGEVQLLCMQWALNYRVQ